MTTGLTLGKFAPLHKGHQLLIETALREVDHLVVIIYASNEVTDVPLAIRAGWIRKLYPSVEVIEAVDGPPDMGDTDAIKHLQETYVLRLLNGRRITHFYSSEFYGDHMSKALRAVNRLVDEARTTVPISATAIRTDPFAHRAYMAPLVYRDLVTNVVFLGAPSTGKTTIAEAMSAVYNTSWMPEYGREYWEQNNVNRRLTKEQLVQLAEGHLEREEALLQTANRYLFTDTNAITTYVFSLDYHGSADDRLGVLAKEAEQRYDLFFVCDTDIPYDDTPDRSGDVHRAKFQQAILHDLWQRKLAFVMLQGSLAERIRKVKEVLGGFQKYR